jgi:hypothetical protein
VTKDDLKTLLSGRGRGLPLFVAWSLAAVFFAIVYQSFMAQAAERDFQWLAIYWGILLLNCGTQSLLLTPYLLTRLGWMIGPFIAEYIARRTPFLGHPLGFWQSRLFLTLLVQSIFLLGSRRRVWLWAAAVILLYLAWFSLHQAAEGLYGWLEARLGSGLWLSLPVIYNRLLPIIVLGAVASFLMPPVGDSTKSAEAERASGTGG